VANSRDSLQEVRFEGAGLSGASLTVALRRYTLTPVITVPSPKHAAGYRRMLVLAGLFMCFVQVQRSAGAVIANELLRQGYSPADIATVVSAMFLASALTQIPTGLAFDRFGATRTLAGASLIAIVGITLFAFATTMPGLTAGRFLIGIGHGGVTAGIYLLALTWVAPSRVATVTGGIVAVAGGAGGLLATAPLLASLQTFGHTNTFLAFGVATLACTGAIAFFVKDAPTSRSAAKRVPETFSESVRGLWGVLCNRQLWPIYAMACCFSVTFHTIGGLWAGPYLHDVQGFSHEQASFGVLAMVAAYHLGNAVYGPAERLFRSRKWTIVGGCVVMIAVMATMAITPAPSSLFAISALSVFCLCTAIYPVLVTHCRAFVPLSHAGRAVACINLAGLVLVFLGQAGTGVVIEATAAADGSATLAGYSAVFACVAALLVLGVAGYLFSEDAPP
jgi:predicted MFS family arabinose efflux permease